MSRLKKDGVFFSCYMSRSEYDMLTAYADKTGLAKTAIVEKAVQAYIGSDHEVADKRLLQFLKKYESGQYVYVGVITRALSVSRQEAIAMLNTCDRLTRIVDYRCPVCNHSNFASETDAADNSIVCGNCDTEFCINDATMDFVYRVK